MNEIAFTVIYFSLFHSLIYAKEISLPDYIKICKRFDPKFLECLINNGNEAIPHIVKGVEEFKTPSLDPFDITEFKFRGGTEQVGFTLALKNGTLEGLKNVKLTSSRFNEKNRLIGFDIYIPKLTVIGKYSMKGRILLLPINSEGDADIEIRNITASYDQEFDLKKRNGKDFLDMNKKGKLIVNEPKTHFNLTNLFGGDPRLSDTLLNFLNQNSAEFHEEFLPPVADGINEIIHNILKRVGRLIAYENLFPA